MTPHGEPTAMEINAKEDAPVTKVHMYRGRLIVPGRQRSSSDDVLGRWYPQRHDGRDLIDKRGPGCRTLDEARAEIDASVVVAAHTLIAASDGPEPAAIVHDFGDGRGAVAAHRHSLGGGWVEDTAFVARSACVAPCACVTNYARVMDKASLTGNAVVRDYAYVGGNARVGGSALVGGKAMVSGRARVIDAAWVAAHAQVTGNAVVRDYAYVGGNARVGGNTTVRGYERVDNDARVGGGARATADHNG